MWVYLKSIDTLGYYVTNAFGRERLRHQSNVKKTPSLGLMTLIYVCSWAQ